MGAERIGLTTRQVFGEPIDRRGVTVVPTAVFVGGGGGEPGNHGFGGIARPLGAIVVEGDRVRWLPAVDVTKVAVGIGTVVALFAAARALRRRRARKALRRESEELRQGLEDMVNEGR